MKDFLFCLFLINIGFTSLIDDVELKISMEKTEFYIHEPIFINVKVINKTNRKIKLPSLGGENIIFQFEHSKGNIPRKFLQVNIANKGTILQPYEIRDAGTMNLLRSYGNKAYPLYSFFDEGEYKITARLRTDGQKKRVELRGKTLQERRREGRELLYALASNQLSFVVKIPTGEDFMAYTLLDSALKIHWREGYQDSKIYDFIKSAELSIKLVNNFPNSRYTLIALNNAAGIYSYLAKFEKRHDLMEHFIIELNKIIAAHPNTFAAQEAQKRLKELHGDKQ